MFYSVEEVSEVVQFACAEIKFPNGNYCSDNFLPIEVESSKYGKLWYGDYPADQIDKLDIITKNIAAKFNTTVSVSLAGADHRLLFKVQQ